MRVFGPAKSMTDLNPTAQAVQDAESAASSGISEVIETALDAQSPFFALPVIKQITDFFIDHIVSALVQDTDYAAYNILTALKTAREKNALTNAEESGDQKAIEEAADSDLNLRG